MNRNYLAYLPCWLYNSLVGWPWWFNRLIMLGDSNLCMVDMMTLLFCPSRKGEVNLSLKFHKGLKFALENFKKLAFKRYFIKPIGHLGTLFLAYSSDKPLENHYSKLMETSWGKLVEAPKVKICWRPPKRHMVGDSQRSKWMATTKGTSRWRQPKRQVSGEPQRASHCGPHKGKLLQTLRGSSWWRPL